MTTPHRTVDWPPGDGEMAQHLRELDWSMTSLRPVSAWSDRLCVMVELMLTSPLVSTLVVGPERVLLYNDAAAQLYGSCHPRVLGRPLSESWPDAYPAVASLYERAFAGEAVKVPAQALDVSQGGGEVFDAYLAPVRDTDGAVFAVHMTGFEVSARLRAEEALREGEARYRQLFEGMEQGFCIIERLDGPPGTPSDYRYLVANPAFKRHTGLRDPVGQTIRELVPNPEASILAIYDEVVRTGEPQRFEAHVSGLDLWMEAEVVSANGPGRIAVLFSNVSDRKRGEAVLRESEEQLRAFGEASSDVLWVRDAERLEWEYLSPAFERIYGMSRAEALTGDTWRNWLDLIVPEDRERARADIGRVRTGERVTFEYRIRRPSDGEVRTLRNTDFPIRDATGQVVRIGGVGHDATEEVAAQAALSASERRLRTLTEGIPQLVWTSANEGRWTWSSPQWSAYTGLTEAESRGLGWLTAVHPDDRAATMQAWEGATEGGGLDVEHRLRHAGTDTFRWFQTRAAPARDEAGRIVEWLGTCTDVQELREMQEHQGVLVAELQHRTRNLMGVVRSLGEQTLRTSRDLEEFAPRFRDRLGALARANGLLSRLDEGQRVTFDELIEAEVRALGDAGQPEGKVTLRGPKGVALRSTGVQTLALALHELATNALKYGALAEAQPAGRLVVAWRVAREEGRPWLHVDWHETGVVMPELVDESGTTARRGAGRELIERALPYQLGARTTYALQEDGVRCTIALPASARRAG